MADQQENFRLQRHLEAIAYRLLEAWERNLPEEPTVELQYALDIMQEVGPAIEEEERVANLLAQFTERDANLVAAEFEQVQLAEQLADEPEGDAVLANGGVFLKKD
jgi:hypothetical protein